VSGIVKVEWTETSQYCAFIELPEGETFEDFDKSRYDMESLVAEYNTDINFEGCERSDIEIYNQQPGLGDDVEEPDWEMFET
jgi:hypothetical protein